MRAVLMVIAYFAFVQFGKGQLTGTVTDDRGVPLSYVSIYVDQSTLGTSSNESGAYILKLGPGTYTILYQYVGYKTERRIVTIGSDGIQVKDVAMSEEQYILKEAVVRADAEDPAYEVIRKAMAKRTFYRDQIDAFSCRSYVKGMYRFSDAPEKIMGFEIGDMGGLLDSSRQGIFYLSESVSDYYYKSPRSKEVMVSSKVSGDDQAFSFNRANLKDIDFYQNTIMIERQMVSPIASSAFQFYTYKLDGIFYDDHGRMINRIEVIPKNQVKPVFSGFIYITEDLWNIHSVDLFSTQDALKIPLIDTLRVQQQFVELNNDLRFVMITQNVSMSFKVLGFKGDGHFTGVFSNYKLDLDQNSHIFNSTAFIAKDSSNLRSMGYWNSIRPVPLTKAEQIDYIRKDSLQMIWNSKEFKDSIDQIGNAFKPINLLFGYTFNKTFDRFSFEFDSPLSTIQFNPVQGYHGNLNFRIRKVADDYWTRYWVINPRLQYGFSDKLVRGGIGFSKKFNAINTARLTIDAGDEVAQYNAYNPISPTINTLYNLIDKNNYIRLYSKRYIETTYQQRILDGIKASITMAYERRSGRQKTTDHSWFDKDDKYADNVVLPLQLNEGLQEIEGQKALTYRLSLDYTIGQRYIQYPNRKYPLPNDLPVFNITWAGGLNILGSDVSYQRVSLSVKDQFTMGTFGKTKIGFDGGVFLSSSDLSAADLFHFNGNQTIIYDPTSQSGSFLNLPYYDFSSSSNFIAFHAQHDFHGFISDRIPLFKRIGWTVTTGIHVLKTGNLDTYYEWNAGLNNVGFGVFRLFSVYAVWSHNPYARGSDFSIRIGVDL